MYKKRLMCAASLAVLAACGGSGGGVMSANGGVQPLEALSFAQLNGVSEALAAKYLEPVVDGDFNAAADLPAGNDVNFAGAIGIGDVEIVTGDADAQILGQLSVNVDFTAADNQVQGTASNFYSTADGVALDGTLALDASIVDTTGQLDGNISGRLTQFDPVDLNLDITGGFIGSNSGAIGGSGTGTALSLDNGETYAAGVVFAAD